MLNPLELVVELCDDITDASLDEPVGRWHWGPALFGFGLGELEQHLDEARYRDWLLRYGEHYLEYPPTIHSADTVAPGLITRYLAKVTTDKRYDALTDRVVDYIKYAPRLVGDAVSHLGRSGWGHIYPKSIWVDSLMMVGVFSARHGRETGDRNLLDIAACQPRQYADLMFDSHHHLWYHSWWAPTLLWKGGPYPGACGKGVFWARGNGWVVAALPMILDAIGKDHPNTERTIEILQATSAALRHVQRPDGTFETLLDPLSRGRNAYRELSATALVASGWLHACRKGYVDEAYLLPARRALHAVTASLKKVNGRWQMPEISGPTVPVPGLPRLGYQIIRTGANYPYGVAAFILAAINHDLLAG